MLHKKIVRISFLATCFLISTSLYLKAADVMEPSVDASQGLLSQRHKALVVIVLDAKELVGHALVAEQNKAIKERRQREKTLYVDNKVVTRINAIRCSFNLPDTQIAQDLASNKFKLYDYPFNRDAFPEELLVEALRFGLVCLIFTDRKNDTDLYTGKVEVISDYYLNLMLRDQEFRRVACEFYRLREEWQFRRHILDQVAEQTPKVNALLGLSLTPVKDDFKEYEKEEAELVARVRQISGLPFTRHF